jgi:inosine-uridine nucleoside N-ribohydrolase
MDGMSLPDVQIPNGGTDAAEQISQILRDSPQKVTILALGPLTNLAEAIQRQPALIKNTEAIVIMGGALEVIGNVGYSGIDNQVAEWNFYIDPLAAQIVLDSGAPIMLAPLDATNDVPVSLEFYRLLKANRRTPEAKFVHELLTNQLDFIASGGYYFWDPLAAGLLADPSLGYIKEGRVKVFTAEGPSSGLTRLMPTGAPVRYTVTAQAELFYQELLRTLNQP